MAAAGDQGVDGSTSGRNGASPDGVTGSQGSCEPPAGTDRINSYSLVSYIPGPLGEFMSRVRRELVPECVAQSHVTVLPPRPLFVGISEAEAILREEIAAFHRFSVELPSIGIFEQTSVVFAAIGRGADELREMHDALATGPFYFDEPYVYHPHVTLAHGFPPQDMRQMYEAAVCLWERSGLPRSFVVENLTFVQNTVANRWIDLAECELRGAPALRR